jgi:aspartate/methionine/tyrosine aminotransferase
LVFDLKNQALILEEIQKKEKIMPRYPDYADRVQRIPASVFEKFRSKMKEKGPYLVRLHIGDTYMHPQYPLPIDADFLKRQPYFNRYCNTFGVEKFRRVLAQKLREDNHFSIDENHILTTNGATNALSAGVFSLINPGEEMMVLTPCWPFFPGMVSMADATVVEVPFYIQLYDDPDLLIESYLDQFYSDRTAAIYLNTPNNPSGKVLNRQQLQQIADYARRRKLWIISDEAYDGLLFDEREHLCIGTLPGMLSQTVSIFTFSKSFMFAGLRLGYLVSGQETVNAINKIMVHQLYSPSTLSQYMMVEPVKKRDTWVPKLCQEYQNLRDMFVNKLKQSVRSPEGTYFLFFPIGRYLNGRSYWQVIEDLLEAGVSVAPGEDFGKGFEEYIRICFTGESPERLETAIDRINQIIFQG